MALFFSQLQNINVQQPFFCYILLETYQISATKTKLQSAEDAMAWATFMDEIFDLLTIARPTILLALPTHVLGG